MASMNYNDTRGVVVIVGATAGRNPGGDVGPYTVSISDPSNTVVLNTANNTLIPNGTNNTGAVVVTVTETGTGAVDTKTLNVVAPGDEYGIQIDFKPVS